jgi:putative intracellular protease/amidase
MKSLKSLIITTSLNKLSNTTIKTGVWLESLACPYFVFKDGGGLVTIASPSGGRTLPAPNSRIVAASENSIRFQDDRQAMYHLGHTLPLSEVKADNYDLAFVTSGYGCMWDLANNQELISILEEFMLHNKPIGLVGHGVAALISLTKAGGEPLIKGRNITALSNSEVKSIKLKEKPPFLLESRLTSLGAHYSKGPDFQSYVVTDGNLITGQNPASSRETSKRQLKMARKEETILSKTN